MVRWRNPFKLSAPEPMSEPDARDMQFVSVAGSSIELEVMIYNHALTDLRPLLILNSIELPMPPSVAFCEQMWRAGYQVIFVRRPGFGQTPGLPAALLTNREVENRSPIAAETALFSLLIDQLELKNVILVGQGTSNSVCLRLAQLNPEIKFCVFANPLFNPAIWDVIRPPWLTRMIRQTLLSKSGLKIAIRGLKAVLRRDPIWFYKQFAQKSEGDGVYISENPTDFRRAAHFLQDITPDTFYYDLQTALVEDTKWDPDTVAKVPAVILSGEESTKAWKRKITNEAARLGLPIVFAPAGDLFVAYVSSDVLLGLLQDADVAAEQRMT